MRSAAIVVAAAALASACARVPPSAVIDQARLRLVVEADGSMAVDDEVVFGSEEPASAVEYRFPAVSLDAVTDAVVTLDGEPLDLEATGGALSIEAEPGGRVRWQSAGGSLAGRRFGVSYRARGVMGVSGARGRVAWPVGPGVAGPVGECDVELVLPPGAVPVVAPTPQGEDWMVSGEAPVYRLSRRAMPAGERPLVAVELILPDLSAPEPGWQVDAARGRDLMPAFVSAGVFMIVVGLGVLWMIRFQYPPLRSSGAGDTGAAVAPQLMDALAAAPALRGVPAATLSSLSSAGLVDSDRVLVGRGLRVAGAVLVGVAAVATVAVAAWLDRLGPWPYALPAGILIVAVMLVLAGWRYPVLTAAGAGAVERARRRVVAR